MKKYLFVIFAILISFGIANAAGIPVTVDPANGPEIWTVEVFNDSGATLQSGATVVWDLTDTDMSAIDARKMYVTTTTSADSVAVAGVVVDPTILDQSQGTIAIWGPVAVRELTNGSMNASELVGTATTAQRATDFTGSAADNGVLGVCAVDNTDPTKGGGQDVAIVFVDITRFSDN